MFVSPENSSVEALTLNIIEVIVMRGWGLWGIITFIEGHEHRAPVKNECPDKKKRQGLTLSPCVRTQ